MQVNYLIIGILSMAIITYIPRSVPLLLFSKHIRSKRIQTFLKYMPFAVLGAMTFPNIIYSTSSRLSAIVGMCAALILSYFERSLLTVTVFTVCVVWIVEKVI